MLMWSHDFVFKEVLHGQVRQLVVILGGLDRTGLMTDQVWMWYI